MSFPASPRVEARTQRWRAVQTATVLASLVGLACLPGTGGGAGPEGDLDGDGVADELDNCSELANPTQLDSDGDHFGNACDPDYDDNEIVGLSDFNLMRAQFGLREEDLDFDRDVDSNGDGAIGLADFNVLRLRFGRAPGPSGLGVPDGWNRVRGRVTALPNLDVDPIPLPEARVFLRSVPGGVERPPDAESDETGSYETATQAVADLYEACAAAPGFTTACHPDLVDFRSRKRFLEIRDLALEPAGDAIRGSVLLTDGSPCSEPARLRLFDQAGALHADVAADGAGRYVAATLPERGAVGFEIGCAGLLVEDERPLDERERGGETPVDWTLPNAAPTIGEIAVRNGQGQAQRFVTPGSDVFLVAGARDPNDDDLAYRWWDEAGSVVSADQSAIAWTAPAASQLDTVFLEVDDGRGGVTREKLALRIGDALDKFAGTVLDDAGDALVGAVVSVDGEEATTEAEGRFALAVLAAAFHVLTVDHPGHTRHVERVQQGAAGVEIRLHPLAFTPFDTTQEILLWDDTRGASLRILPNSLVDSAGALVKRAHVAVHTHEPTSEAPLGSRVLATGVGAPPTYHAAQGMSVEIVDDAGQPLQLAAGAEAVVGFQAPPLAEAELPRTLALAHLDETTGLWESIGEAARIGSRYEGLVSSFSAWSTGSSAAGDTACLRIVTQGALQLPVRLRVYTQPSFAPFDVEYVDDYTLQERENAIFRLPAHHFARIELRAFTDPETVIATHFVPTGGAVSPPEPAYPYTPCQDVEVGADLPVFESEYNTPPHFLRRLGIGDEATAQAYYQAIGAVPAKDDFQKWLDANGFVPADRFEDVTFFNPNEIGLTRRANCKRLPGSSPPTSACYVTKFGHVGESPFDSLWDGLAGLYPGDTVAMEYTLVPGETYLRSVKFYIYAPGDTPAQQPLKTHTAFDTDGDTKYVPNVCQHCHGAGQSQFVAFDPHQYQYLGVGQSHLANVQERFRQFNALIYPIAAATSPPWIEGGHNGTRNLIEDLYGDDIFVPGTEAGPGLHGDLAYDEVVKPYCRTCHMFSAFRFEFVPTGTNPFRHFGGLAGVANSHMCSGEMPHAMQPQLALWSSANPFLPAVFPLGCIEPNAPPNVQITAPSDGFDVGFGGLALETYTASVSDAEDGTSCCSVEWTGDGDVMGYGLSVPYVFGAPGDHDVCATATDSFGKTGQDCITVSSSNQAPNVTIHVPVPGQIVQRGVPANFWGVAFDLNEPYLNLPCTALQWSFPTGPMPRPAPVTGCQPVVTFTHVGSYGVRLDASDGTDADFATSSVVVQDTPAGSPPSVTITSPDFGSLYPPNAPLLLEAVIINHGGGAITRQWTVDPGFGPPIPISTANPGSWVPSSTLPGDCGSQPVEIRLDATNANGTGTDARTIEIGWGPC